MSFQRLLEGRMRFQKYKTTTQKTFMEHWLQPPLDFADVQWLAQQGSGWEPSPSVSPVSTWRTRTPSAASTSSEVSVSLAPVDSTTTNASSDSGTHNVGPGYSLDSVPDIGSPLDQQQHARTFIRPRQGSRAPSFNTARLLCSGPTRATGRRCARLRAAVISMRSLPTFTFEVTTLCPVLLLTMRDLWLLCESVGSFGVLPVPEKADWRSNKLVRTVYNLTLKIPAPNGGAATALINMLLWMR